MFSKFMDWMWGAKTEGGYDDYDDYADDQGYSEDPSDGYERSEKYAQPLPEKQSRPAYRSEKETAQAGKRRVTRDGKVISVPEFDAFSSSRVVISQPKDVEEATTVANYLSEGFICIVNLETVEKPNSQRIADFLGGACFALHGSVARISREIFVIVPFDVSLSSEMQEELKNKTSSILPKFVAAFK